MGALNLKNAHAADSKLIKSRVRSTIRAAMDPLNPNYMITSIKIDFSNGPLLVGDDPRYVYRSPEMTIEAIPVGPSPYSESDVSIASEIVDSGTRHCAGGEVSAFNNDCEEQLLKGNPSILNEMEDGLPTENAYEIYQTYLKANDLTEEEHPFIPNDTDTNHMSKENIVQWMEEGERATTSAPQKAEWEYGIREIDRLLLYSDAETLKDVASLESADDDSDSFVSGDDFSDVPIIHTPFPSGSRESTEETMKRRTPKTFQ
uniref:Uncharacterized protein n=1 Tax=Panagrolaimus sp. ES5 TaxID=591445 RepID=A0AC34FLE3_9BILA